MGKYSAEYEVYYKERGNKNSSRIFKTEAEACDYFLYRIKSWILMAETSEKTYDFVCFGDLAYEFDFSDHEEAEKKIKRKLSQILN